MSDRANSDQEPGIAYGFGSHRGLLVDRNGIEEIVYGRVLLYLEKPDTDLIRGLAPRLSGVIVEEPVTPYAPEARALWTLPVPVLTGVRVDDSWLGHEVIVDFDAVITAPPAPAVVGLRLHVDDSSLGAAAGRGPALPVRGGAGRPVAVFRRVRPSAAGDPLLRRAGRRSAGGVLRPAWRPRPASGGDRFLPYDRGRVPGRRPAGRAAD